MSEIAVHANVTETRQAYIQEVEAQQWENRQRARRLAREMVVAMSGREDFTIEDFIFAASLGEPERYPEEKATLETIAQLTPGEIVGVISDDKLRIVGVAGNKPLTMTVDVRTPADLGDEQYHRHLEAYLNLLTASRRAVEDSRYPRVDVETHAEPMAVPILRAWGEPEFDSSAFFQPQSVVVGAEAVLNRVAQEDTLGTKQVADCLTHLAKIAFSSYTASQES